VIGPDIPPELVAFYGGVLTAAIIYRQSATAYTYYGISAGNHMVGTVNTGVVHETYELSGSVLESFLTYGSVSDVSVAFESLSRVLFGGVDVQIRQGTGFLIDLVSQPRGLRAYVSGTLPIGAIGAEQVLLTSAAVDFENGEAYRVAVGINVTPAAAAAANAQVIRVRVTNLAGTVERTWVQRCIVVGTESCYFEFVAVRTAGTTLTTPLVVTGQGLTNTFTADVAGNTPFFLQIDHAGTAAQFPNANVLI